MQRGYARLAWLTGWLYRKSHVISYAAGAGTLYQKQITVYYGAGEDSNGNIYCTVGGVAHCKTDFGDIRFTTDDGSSELDYWLEDTSLINGTSCTFWVEIIGDLSTVNKTIYVYYGKSDATTTSNGANTFLMFNHFDDATLSPWSSIGGTPTESGTELVINAGGEGAYGNASYNNNRIKWRGKHTYVNYGYWGLSAANDLLGGVFNSESFFIYSDHISAVSHNAGYTITNLGNLGTDYMLWEILWVSGSRAEFLVNGVSKAIHTTNISTTAQPPKFYDYSGAPIMTLDWLFVAKYVYPEPAHSTWGNEEVSTTTVSITYPIDVWLKKIDAIKTYSLDTPIQQQNLLKTYQIDLVLGKLNLVTTDLIDVLFKIISIRTDSVDVVFKKYEVIRTDSIDAALIKLGITKTDSIDMFFKKVGITNTFIIDAALGKLGLTKTNSIDTWFAKIGIKITNPIDVLFLKFGVITVYSLDLVIGKTQQYKTSAIDFIIIMPFYMCPRCRRYSTTLTHIINMDFCGFEFICPICYNEVTANGRLIPYG